MLKQKNQTVKQQQKRAEYSNDISSRYMKKLKNDTEKKHQPGNEQKSFHNLSA